ncbi:MAG: hypothetical protein KGI69_02960 [Patescibacteria group bacterium]|nr:hypothetical protein [Patescibacteria group bacterium]
MNTQTHSSRASAVIVAVVGVIFVILAIYYWVTPAGSLPSFMPGFESGSSHVHLKHGAAALIAGLGVLAYAWFRSGGQRPKKASDDSAPTITQ